MGKWHLYFNGDCIRYLCHLLAQDPSLTAAEVETLLKDTALRFGEPGPEYGYGLVQADKALDMVKSRMALIHIQEHTSLAMNLWQLR